MRFIQLGLWTSLTLLLGCKPDYQNDQAINLKDAYQETTSISLSKLYNSVELIPLESNDSSFIASIKKILISDSNIVIYDDLANRVLLFDRRGNFKRILTRSGKGPGEFIHILDINYNYNNSEVLLYDDYRKKFISFGIDGLTCSERNVGAHFARFLNLGISDTIYARQTLQAITYKTCLLDKNGLSAGKRHCLIPYDTISIQDQVGFRPVKLYLSQDEITYWDFIHNTFYRFDSLLNLTSVLEIQTNSNYIPKEIRAFDQVYFKEYKNYDRFLNFTETSEYIYFNGTLAGGRWNPILYNKTTNVGRSIDYDKNFSPGGINDDLLGLIPFWPTSTTKAGDPFDIMNRISVNDYLQFNKLDTSQIVESVRQILTQPLFNNPIIRILK